MKIKLLLLCFVLLAFSPSYAQKTRPASTDTVTVKLDIPYTTGKKGPLLANLYLPKEAKAGKPFPVIVYIHGGGWMTGSRDGLDGMAKYMGDRGYAGFDLDYDLIPAGGTFPVSLDECWQALVYLKQHAAEYGIDPTRIAVAGGSAGGELTGLVGYGVRQPAGAPSVKAVVLLNAVIDLRGSDDKQLATNYLGKPCSQVSDLCAEASPIVAAAHKGLPATFIGHGTADKTVPFQQGVDLKNKLKSLGVPTQEFVAEGAPHAYFSKEPWQQKNLEAMAEFFSTYL